MFIVIALSIAMLSTGRLGVIMLSIIIPIVINLIGLMLSIVMLIVVVPMLIAS